MEIPWTPQELNEFWIIMSEHDKNCGRKPAATPELAYEFWYDLYDYVNKTPCSPEFTEIGSKAIGLLTGKISYEEISNVKPLGTIHELLIQWRLKIRR